MRNRSSELARPVDVARLRAATTSTSAAGATDIVRRGENRRPAAAIRNTEVLLDKAMQRIAHVAPAALRLSLAVIFLWFGALKIAGVSPVAKLVAATLPWADPNVVVRALGVVEVAIALCLLIGRVQRFVLIVLAMHLSGTFLTFLMAPGMTMRHGDPFLLTADGEFVIKNLVLISAALLLASHRYAVSHRGGRAVSAPAT